jgi:hypothetical protein
LDAPAQEIADLYKRRWAIELFFRWVKQTLKIRHFVGQSLDQLLKPPTATNIDPRQLQLNLAAQ